MSGYADSVARSRLWATLGIVLLSVLWGYTWVIAKQALDFAPPFSLTFVRVFGGSLALFVALKLLRQPLKLEAPRTVLLISLCQVSGFMLLQTLSLKFGAAGKTAVLVYTMPIWTLLLAWPLLGERVRGGQWFAVAAILGGLLLIIEPWNLQSSWLSNGFGIGAAMCWAMGTVLVKKLRRHSQVGLLSLTAWSNLMGCIPVALIASVVDEPPIQWSSEFIAPYSERGIQSLRNCRYSLDRLWTLAAVVCQLAAGATQTIAQSLKTVWNYLSAFSK